MSPVAKIANAVIDYLLCGMVFFSLGFNWYIMSVPIRITYIVICIGLIVLLVHIYPKYAYISTKKIIGDLVVKKVHEDGEVSYTIAVESDEALDHVILDYDEAVLRIVRE